MRKLLILYGCLFVLFSLNQVSLYGEPGDWINHAGPWYIPHSMVGNPAIGNLNNDQYLYDPTYAGFDPPQYGTFRSMDLGATWLYVDDDCEGGEAVTFLNHGDYSWICGEGFDERIRRTTDGGESWNNATTGLRGSPVLCIDLFQSSYDQYLEGTTL